MSEILITTGCRLHFGLILSEPGGAWNYGGFGLMLRTPGWTQRMQQIDGSQDVVTASEEAALRIRQTLKRLREVAAIPSVRCVLTSEVPFHSGLGSGTQLALAVVAGLRKLVELKPGAGSFELARVAGRAERSGVGTSGFDLGGLLVDRGQAAEPDRIERMAVPEDWRFVLIRPELRQGLNGRQEQAFFSRRLQMSDDLVSELTTCLTMDLVPAVQRSDFARFACSLERYGDLVGQFYSPTQGGIFADAAIRQLVEQLRAEGIRGAAQSSWGPGICIPASCAEEARELGRRIPESIGETRLVATITSALNTGATIRRVAPETRDGVVRA